MTAVGVVGSTLTEFRGERAVFDTDDVNELDEVEEALECE